jgi:uncharacterized delta-60 repeat protein
VSLHPANRSQLNNSSRSSVPNASRKRRCGLRRSRVGSLASRFGMGFGVEQLEDRRLLAAGSLDTTFNPGGLVPGVVIQNFAFEDNGVAVAVDSAGRTLVAGTYGTGAVGSGDFAVARFNVDGSLDTTFGGGDGLATIDFGSQDDGRDVLIDSTTGKITVVGRSQSGGFDGIGIARLDATGALDPTFGTGGKTVTTALGVPYPFSFGLNWQLDPRGAAFDAAGNVVVAGRAIDAVFGTYQDFVVARYTPSGVLDSSFATASPFGAGIAVTDFGGSDEAFDVAVQGDGSIIAVGRGRQASDAANLHFAIARYTSTGLLDSSFDGDGLVTSQVPAFGATRGHQINGVSLQLDGKIVVAGISQAGVQSDVVVARYNTNGLLDTSFDSDGFNDSIGVPFSSFDDAQDVAIQSDGAILVVGSTEPSGDSRLLLVRLTTNGALDASFDGDSGTGNGVVTTNASLTPGDIDQAFAVAITADGKTVVGGRALASGSNFLAARYDLALLSAEAGGPYNLTEAGGTIQLFGSSTSPGATFAWDLDGDSIFGESGPSAANGDENLQNPFYTSPSVDGPAAITVSLQVTVGSSSVTDMATINIANVDPIAVLANNGPVDEGSTATVSFSGQFDPSAADVTAGLRYAYDFNDDGIWEVGQPSYSLASSADSVVIPASYLDDGPMVRQVRARIIDKDGGFSEYTTQITVNNVAPTLVISGASNVDEGSSYTLALSASDPGPDTISTWTIAWGDGNFTTVPGGTAMVSHTYADGPASYTISATAADEDGSYSSNSLPVTVDNVAPTLTISGASNVAEGSSYTLTLGSSDPGQDAITSWTINWGDGIEVISGNPGSVSHTYADGGNPSTAYTITATATDEDGTYSSNSLGVSVLNVAPTASAGGPYQTFDDTTIILTATGSDPAGAADPLSYLWDLDGDNVFGEIGVGAARGNEVGQSVTFNPAGAGGTTATVKVKALDDDGGESAVAVSTVEVLTQGTLLIGGVLHVVGSNCGDWVFINETAGVISVVATSNANNPATFASSSVTAINVRTRGGNDVVITSGTVMKPMTIDGGSGNDFLMGGGGANLIIGGSGCDTLYGAAGDDVLLGGDGNDDLLGGDGNDVLVGGWGDDNLCGGNGRDLIIGGQDDDDLAGGLDEDILIGGYTIHDGNLAALDQIMAVWTSSSSFSARVATLTNSSTGLLRNGYVIDDNDRDEIDGGSGRDLYFADMSTSGDGVKDAVMIQSTLDALVAVN